MYMARTCWYHWPFNLFTDIRWGVLMEWQVLKKLRHNGKYHFTSAVHIIYITLSEGKTDLPGQVLIVQPSVGEETESRSNFIPVSVIICLNVSVWLLFKKWVHKEKFAHVLYCLIKTSIFSLNLLHVLILFQNAGFSGSQLHFRLLKNKTF